MPYGLGTAFFVAFAPHCLVLSFAGHIMRSTVCIGMLLYVCFATAGCGAQHAPTSPQRVVAGDVASGKILVDILDSRWHEHYYQYEIRPANGSVALTREETFNDYQHEQIPHEYRQPTGAIDDCLLKKPAAKSPDGKYVAGCKEESLRNGQFSFKYFQIFFITEAETGKELFHWKLDDWRRIHGFSWSPNSQSVALLNSTQVFGKGPFETIWAWAGHPVPHDTVYLSVIPVSTLQPVEYRIRGDVLYAFTRILDWSLD